MGVACEIHGENVTLFVESKSGTKERLFGDLVFDNSGSFAFKHKHKGFAIHD